MRVVSKATIAVALPLYERSVGREPTLKNRPSR